MTEPNVYISASPHVHNKKSNGIQNIMFWVIIALLPSCIWGIISFGWRALVVILTSVCTSVLTEFLIDKFLFKNNNYSVKDLSAIVTGLLIGMNLSSLVPIYVPIIASVFAIAICKMCFGGIGQNWANPALGGRVFVMFSFASAMGHYASPLFLKDSVATLSGATPLSYVSSNLTAPIISSASVTSASISSASLTAVQPLGNVTEVLQSVNYPISSFASKVFNVFHINPYYTDAFVGNISGCIGEISALLLIVGGIILLSKKIITWHIPCTFIGTFMLCTWVFGGLSKGFGWFKGDAIWGVLTGGLLLGSIFMATDMVTTPITHKGQIIFGMGCGFLTFFFRTFASLPEGVSVSILLMNIVSPFIDRVVKVRVYGHPKKQLFKKRGTK